MKSFNFDGHKLIHHLERVHEFTSTGDCYPLYLEISPVGICNHRCIFCAYDYIGYPNRKLETARTLTLLDELAQAGLKSVLFAGEGEPLVHPDLAKMVLRAYDRGIDVGLFTNGQLLTRELAEAMLPALTFVRFSFNGGGRDNYAAIHSVRPEAFDTVVANIAAACEIRDRRALTVDIGAQFVLLPENRERLLSAVATLKECGVDYLAIKPFMQREGQSYRMESGQYEQESLQALFAEAESHSTDSFRVIARKDTFQDYGTRNYCNCFGTSFIAVLNSAGVLSSCLPYWEREEFSFGSIYQQSFQEIWHSPKRAQIKEHLERTLDAQGCPPNCRPHAINQFLADILHPEVKHINFI